MTPSAALEHGLNELALPLPAGAAERLLDYLALLSKWNRTYNLTAIRNRDEMLTHHQFVLEIPSFLVHPLAPTILIKSVRGTGDPKPCSKQAIGENRCGFCGLEGCLTQLQEKKKGGLSVASNCPYHYGSGNEL